MHTEREGEKRINKLAQGCKRRGGQETNGTK